MRLSLKELRERREQGRTEAESRRPSGIPVEVVLKATAPIEQPVALARALTDFGLSLAEAHDTLNRLVASEAVPVTLYLTQSTGSPFTLCRFGLAIGQPIEPQTNVRSLLSIEAADALESWRRAQPAQPSAQEAIRAMVREYLIGHGAMAGEDERQQPKLDRTE